MVEAKKLQLETEGVTVRDSEFNCGAGPLSTRRLATGTRKVIDARATPYVRNFWWCSKTRRQGEIERQCPLPYECSGISKISVRDLVKHHNIACADYREANLGSSLRH